jgi:hypothetical protein
MPPPLLTFTCPSCHYEAKDLPLRFASPSAGGFDPRLVSCPACEALDVLNVPDVEAGCSEHHRPFVVHADEAAVPCPRCGSTMAVREIPTKTAAEYIAEAGGRLDMRVPGAADVWLFEQDLMWAQVEAESHARRMRLEAYRSVPREVSKRAREAEALSPTPEAVRHLVRRVIEADGDLTMGLVHAMLETVRLPASARLQEVIEDARDEWFQERGLPVPEMRPVREPE